MTHHYQNLRIFIAILIVAISCIGVLAYTPTLDSTFGRGDFRINWTASRLLRGRENMYDYDRVFEVQRSLTGWWEDYPMVTLSPPYAALILFPLADLPYNQALWLWLVTNVLLAAISAILIWRGSVSEPFLRRRLWIPLLVAFTYSITLTSLVIGQYTILILAVSAAYLMFWRRRQDFLAGAMLSVMFIKPQMIFFTALVLFLDVLRRRRWWVLVGMITTIVFSLMLLFFLRPYWVTEYSEALQKGRTLWYESSNVSGLLFVLSGWIGFKFIAILVLPFVLLAWKRFELATEQRFLVDITVMLSVITAPYDFSYDHVILLFPLLTITKWLAEKRLTRWETIAIIGVLLAANGFSFFLRVLTPSDVYFFWVPLAIAIVYAYMWWRILATGQGFHAKASALERVPQNG